MNRKVAIFFLFLLTTSQSAWACGTRAPEVQGQIDAQERAALKALTIKFATDADLVIIGKVTSLDRPVVGDLTPGSVTLEVLETLKGIPASTQTIEWQEAFILSCRESDSFRNVGFRKSGLFIVYIQDGQVIRSAAADELRKSSLLKLADERALVRFQGGI